MAEAVSGERQGRSMRALLVPADLDQPPRVVDLNEPGTPQYRVIQRYVGGTFDVQAHDEADLWLNDEGRINGSPLNARVSHWSLNDSAHAKAGDLAGVEEYWTVYGDVLVTGPADAEGDVTPVSLELVEHFQAMSLHPDAMRDFDGREVEWKITDWPDEQDRDTGRDI